MLTVKNWGIAESDQVIVYLKGSMIINGMSFQVKMLWSWLHGTSISGKVAVIKHYILLRKVQLLKKSCSEECVLRKSTCSE